MLSNPVMRLGLVDGVALMISRYGRRGAGRLFEESFGRICVFGVPLHDDLVATQPNLETVAVAVIAEIDAHLVAPDAPGAEMGRPIAWLRSVPSFS